MSWVIESWAGKGPEGSIECYWSPGRKAGPSKLLDGLYPLSDENWSFDIYDAKRYPTKEAGELELVAVLLHDYPKHSDGVEVINVAFQDEVQS